MIEDYFEKFHEMNRVSYADSLAGMAYKWQDGAPFLAGCVMNNSAQAQVAYQQGAKVTFTIVLPLTVNLSIGDRIKRVGTGTIMTVTSNPEDMIPPSVASEAMAYKQCTAEVVE